MYVVYVTNFSMFVDVCRCTSKYYLPDLERGGVLVRCVLHAAAKYYTYVHGEGQGRNGHKDSFPEGVSVCYVVYQCMFTSEMSPPSWIAPSPPF